MALIAADNVQPIPASLARRLAAATYDLILCLALLMAAAALYKLAQMGWYGEARLRVLSEAGALDHDPWLSLLLTSLSFAFFARFWTHAGQTLGMQAWGIRVQNTDGSTISPGQALLRFALAMVSWLCLGLGWWWMLIERRQRTWHDLGSRSQVVRIGKEKTGH
ncbi:RDD family protein [Pseudomonas sp. CFBP 13719]|uniref:RDD family protein n=1 Tax=Pseudomonas sp. CFBP 13719 TaxID=2775303 RepID=UPI00177D0E1C|nr:RDD family protein [Pseudomonas sp. CFBP 13719]MBD8681113.1 RDD family protein [Pseudomonas sp. CFBP 13719]